MRTEDWGIYKSSHDYANALARSNPSFKRGIRAWSKNCQRCVPTYEMQKRGFDVSANPIAPGYDYLSYHPYDVWKDPIVHNTPGTGRESIEQAMASYGDGARAQVTVQWSKEPGGHTFIAEQKEGKTHFIDPQTGSTDAAWYFDDVLPGATQFARIDNLTPSDRIFDCCDNAQKNAMNFDAMGNRVSNYSATIPAQDIDMSTARGLPSTHFWDRGRSEKQFWENHGSHKDFYLDQAKGLPEVQTLLARGQSVDQIHAERPYLRNTIDAYYNPDNMLRVSRDADGSYHFGDDGKHRILAARELGYNVPAQITDDKMRSNAESAAPVGKTPQQIEQERDADRMLTFRDPLTWNNPPGEISGQSALGSSNSTVSYSNPEITKSSHKGMPARTDAYLPTDDRGHILASSLGGSNDPSNIVPQDRDVNRRGYRDLERGETDALKSGATIDSVRTVAREGRPDSRPSAFMVTDTVHYPDGHTEQIHSSFTNASYAEQREWDAIAATIPDDYDPPNPGDKLRESMSPEEYDALMDETDQYLTSLRDDYAPTRSAASEQDDAPENSEDTTPDQPEADPGETAEGSEKPEESTEEPSKDTSAKDADDSHEMPDADKAPEDHENAEADKAAEDHGSVKEDKADKEREDSEEDKANQERKNSEEDKINQGRENSEEDKADKEHENSEEDKANQEHENSKGDKADKEHENFEEDKANQERENAEGDKADKEHENSEEDKANQNRENSEADKTAEDRGVPNPNQESTVAEKPESGQENGRENPQDPPKPNADETPDTEKAPEAADEKAPAENAPAPANEDAPKNAQPLGEDGRTEGAQTPDGSEDKGSESPAGKDAHHTAPRPDENTENAPNPANVQEQNGGPTPTPNQDESNGPKPGNVQVDGNAPTPAPIEDESNGLKPGTAQEDGNTPAPTSNQDETNGLKPDTVQEDGSSLNQPPNQDENNSLKQSNAREDGNALNPNTSEDEGNGQDQGNAPAPGPSQNPAQEPGNTQPKQNSPEPHNTEDQNTSPNADNKQNNKKDENSQKTENNTQDSGHEPRDEKSSGNQEKSNHQTPSQDEKTSHDGKGREDGTDPKDEKPSHNGQPPDEVKAKADGIVDRDDPGGEGGKVKEDNGIRDNPSDMGDTASMQDSGKDDGIRDPAGNAPSNAGNNGIHDPAPGKGSDPSPNSGPSNAPAATDGPAAPAPASEPKSADSNGISGSAPAPAKSSGVNNGISQ